MTRSRTYRVLVAALLLVGCVSTGMTARHLSAILPAATDAESDSTFTGDPWKDLAIWEADYRGGFGRSEPEPFYADQYTGVATLVYPATTRSAAASGYVRIGNEFLSVGEVGAAGRAYWAALTLLDKTFASRSQKETARAGAYRGLQKVSLSQGESARASLMGLAARLSEIYLSSPQALADDSLFYREIIKWKGVQLAAEKKQADIERRQTWVAILQGINGAVQANAVPKGDVAGSLAVGQQVAADAAATDRVFAQQMEQVTRSLRQYSSQIRALKAGLTDNAIDFGSGLSRTLGEEIVYALATAQDEAPYRTALQEFAADKPALRSALNQPSATKDEDILRIATAFLDYEKSIPIESRTQENTP